MGCRQSVHPADATRTAANTAHDLALILHPKSLSKFQTCCSQLHATSVSEMTAPHRKNLGTGGNGTGGTGIPGNGTGTGGFVTGGIVTGGIVTGGIVSGGIVTGGNVSGGNVSGGNVT